MKARARFDEANQSADLERGTTCKKRCANWEQRAKEVQALINQLEHDLAALGPARPTNVKAERAAQIAALLGGDHDRIKSLIVLLDPVAVPFLLEWSAIVAFGFGFGHRRTIQGPALIPNLATRPAIVGSKMPAKAVPAGNPGYAPIQPAAGRRGRKSNVRIIDFSDQFRTKHGRSPSPSELKLQFPDIPRSTIYEYAARIRNNVVAISRTSGLPKSRNAA